MNKKPHQFSLIIYRTSRAFISAVLTVAFAMASVGSWQSMSSPKQFNPKSLSYYETTVFDVIFGFIFTGLWGFFALIAFIYLLLFTFSTEFSKDFYRKKNENENDT